MWPLLKQDRCKMMIHFLFEIWSPFFFWGIYIYIYISFHGGVLYWNFVRHLLGSLSTVKRKTPLEGNPNLQVRGLSHQKARKKSQNRSQAVHHLESFRVKIHNVWNHHLFATNGTWNWIGWFPSFVLIYQLRHCSRTKPFSKVQKFGAQWANNR